MALGIGLAAATILLTNGVMEGVLTNRWHRPVELETGIGRLTHVPMTIGEWHAQPEELDEASQTRAGIKAISFGTTKTSSPARRLRCC